MSKSKTTDGQTTKMTPMEQAMSWERMSGERLSEAERKRIMDGGEFTPPHLQTTARPSYPRCAVCITPVQCDFHTTCCHPIEVNADE